MKPYAEMTVDELKEEEKRQAGIEDAGYWGFTRRAGRYGAGYLEQMSNAGREKRLIREEIRRREEKGEC
jgi:hypothetical protein